jgi:hypothetical protein
LFFPFDEGPLSLCSFLPALGTLYRLGCTCLLRSCVAPQKDAVMTMDNGNENGLDLMIHVHVRLIQPTIMMPWKIIASA